MLIDPPPPWRVAAPPTTFGAVALLADDDTPILLYHDPGPETLAVLRRIAAAVNATAHIDIQDLETLAARATELE